MSSNAPESAQKSVSFLLYIAILWLLAIVIAWDTEWSAIEGKLADDVVSDWARCIVASLVLHLIFRCLFSNLGGGLTSVNLGGTTMYVLMVFIIGLLSTIYSNTGSSSDSDE